jgi:hypothetical protein
VDTNWYMDSEATDHVTGDLNNILHVPKACKSLLSINHLTRDYNVFLEFYPDHFSIKEWGTRRTLLKGRYEGGFYPLMSVQNKQVLPFIRDSNKTVFVMHVKRARVISCPTLDPLVCLLVLWIFFF